MLRLSGEHKTHRATGTIEALTSRADSGDAVIASIRPDLVAIDLDGCASLVWPDIEHAADMYAAAIVYTARSGSADSMHAVLAPYTAQSRSALLDALDDARTQHGLTRSQVDHRHGAGGGMRMPGSAALKHGGGRVVPVGASGRALSPAGAYRRAASALRDAGLPVSTQVTGGTHDCGKIRHIDTQGVEGDRFGHQLTERLHTRTNAPVLDARARRALGTFAPAGADRTGHAVAAAWHLWRCGFRHWKQVADVVMSAPALARWRAGGEREARRRWRIESRRWASYRPVMAGDDARVWTAAHGAVKTLPGDLEAVAVAVLEVMGLRGRVSGVPVGARDLVVWGVAGSVDRAWRSLEALEGHGVLSRVRRWADGPAYESTLWALCDPASWQVTAGSADTRHFPNIDTQGVRGGIPTRVTHPVWLEVGHHCRRVLEVLESSPGAAAADVADALGVNLRAVQRRLVRLESAGLAQRGRSGRRVTWSASGVRLESLTVADRAVEAWRERCRAVGAERSAWRAVLEASERAYTAPMVAGAGDCPVTTVRRVWGDSGGETIVSSFCRWRALVRAGPG